MQSAYTDNTSDCLRIHVIVSYRGIAWKGVTNLPHPLQSAELAIDYARVSDFLCAVGTAGRFESRPTRSLLVWPLQLGPRVAALFYEPTEPEECWPHLWTRRSSRLESHFHWGGVEGKANSGRVLGHAAKRYIVSCHRCRYYDFKPVCTVLMLQGTSCNVLGWWWALC